MIDDAGHGRFAEACERAQVFVLTTHVNPDGDAIGSQVSLAQFLLSRGKRIRIVNQDRTPANLRFICDPQVALEPYDHATHDSVFDQADRIILLDNAAPDRLGAMEPVMRQHAAKTLCVDHHPVREMPWTHSIIDESACATAVLVYELLLRQGWTPNPSAAEALYVGLATDTGFFRFNSTNVQAHEIAAELIRLGASPSTAFREIYERNSLAFTRLLGHALAGVEMSMQDRVATVRITRALIERLDAGDVDTSEITTSLLAMEGLHVALLFRELDGGKVKVSLRSKGRVNVHRLATEFGGGGHRNASGIVMQGTLEQAVRAVTERVNAAVG